MDIRELLCERVKKYEDVIIYGYRDIGKCVLDYLINLETDIKMSNYSGRVKYFTTSNPLESENELKGIPIKSIDELSDYADSALVIIATQEQHHEIISGKLDELQFAHRMFITHEMYIILKEIVGNYNRGIDAQVRQYSMMHEMKLERLQRKIRNGERAKVFFMTQRAAAFGAASVYREMKKSDIFDPYVMCISKRDIWYNGFYDAVEEDVKFFTERGFRAFNAYDENRVPKDLTELNPDIIFFDSPNLYGPAFNSHFRLDQINWKYLTCYIPYGLLMVDSFYYHYNNINVRTCWKFFLDTDSSYDRALRDAEFNGMNIVKAGYPKFDDYESSKNGDLPQRLNNDNKTVIYAPHWSLDIENNFATFDLYKDIIFEFAKDHPDINFVFKPHPELEFRIKNLHAWGKSNFSQEDYKDYIHKWNDLPNGLCITQGGYINIFEHSDCMITDCGSFIGEYLLSLKPCIYLFNPRKKHQKDTYTPLAKKILDTYYIAENVTELKKYFQHIILDGCDGKKSIRQNVLKSEFKMEGSIGKRITSYLTNELIE